jgi:hypothetical protein
MPSMKILRDLKTKADAKNPRPTITEGTVCDVRFYKHKHENGFEYDMMEINAPNGAVWNLSTRHGILYFKKMPSMKKIESWVEDSVCRSVTGGVCEPDGYTHDGAPSWLLVLGMI